MFRKMKNQINGPNNWTLSGLVDRPSYRVNCSSGGTIVPDIGNAGLPTLNSTYNVTLDDAVPQAFAVCVSGLSDTVYNGGPLPLALPGAPGCNLMVSADVLDLRITSPQGTASRTFSIPSSPAYVGVDLFHQWAVLDAVNTLGIVVSDAGKATIDQ